MHGCGSASVLRRALIAAVLTSIMVLTCPAIAGAEVLVRRSGVVVDARDKPVRDVVVAAHRWNGYIGEWEVVSTDITERDGLFAVTIRTWYYGCTYYYLTFEHSKYADVRIPECGPDDGFYESVCVEFRCDECTTEPLTVLMVREH